MDALLELTRPLDKGRRVATGKALAAQIKFGASAVHVTSQGFTLYCTAEKKNYWLGYSLPVVVLYGDPATSIFYWAQVTGDSLRPTDGGYALDIPRQNRLAGAAEALARIAEGSPSSHPSAAASLLFEFDEQAGLLLDDDELGMACAEIAQSARAGRRPRVEIEIRGHADLISQAAALREGPAPTLEDRRNFIILEEICQRYAVKAAKLARRLTFLLVDERFNRAVALDPGYYTKAVRGLASFFVLQTPRPARGVTLVAWPSFELQEPAVKFDLDDDEKHAFYSARQISHPQVELGPYGGFMAVELGPELFRGRFIPTLVHVLHGVAEQNAVDAGETLDRIGIDPEFWLLGLS